MLLRFRRRGVGLILLLPGQWRRKILQLKTKMAVEYEEATEAEDASALGAAG